MTIHDFPDIPKYIRNTPRLTIPAPSRRSLAATHTLQFAPLAAASQNGLSVGRQQDNTVNAPNSGSNKDAADDVR